MKRSKQLEAFAAKYPEIVDQYFVDEDGHWIWLKSGYYFEATECGTTRGDTARDVQRDIKYGIYRGNLEDGSTQIADNAERVV